MKSFLILHYGYESPTPEVMATWNRWFESISDIEMDRGGLRGGRKIRDSGMEDLPFSKNSPTGYTIIEAGSLEETVNIAKDCPVVESTRVFEIQR